MEARFRMPYPYTLGSAPPRCLRRTVKEVPKVSGTAVEITGLDPGGLLLERQGTDGKNRPSEVSAIFNLRWWRKASRRKWFLR